MLIARSSLVIGLLLLASSGCAGIDKDDLSASGTVMPTGGGPSVISGDDALRLYGLTPGAMAAPVTPTSDGGPWFPRAAWVTASVLPYDGESPIRILPVYSDPTLDVGGTWLGDLVEGSRANLLGVDQGGRACLVEGESSQGWGVQGWVACNRLLFDKPTLVP